MTAGLTRRPRLLVLVAVLVLVLVATAALLLLRDDGDLAEDPAPESQAAAALREVPARWEPALSEPVEDSVYPEVGDPGVDALHYDLDLAWEPDTEVLTGTATITLRATADAEESGRLQLDLGEPLEVEEVLLDGTEVQPATDDSELDTDGTEAAYRHTGKDLVVAAPVAEDEVRELVVTYSGTPEPVEAPTSRGDFETTGWTVSRAGDVWTMQEPFGAYSWYPVHDHPSDKAFYDVEISAPEPLVGVANGTLRERRTTDGTTTTRWRLRSPAASYLVTIAIGDYQVVEETSESGVPLSYWVLRGDQRGLRALRKTPEALAWVEERLGEYPFESLGVLLTDSRSGMETQTMITLGRTPYVQSPPVLVHEIAHHWYGNTVTPSDWSDLWMNEGMAMYLQLIFEAERAGIGVDAEMRSWEWQEPFMREEGGPPGDYDRDAFAESVVYIAPALMWHEVRERVGDEAFWDMVRRWPQEREDENATREEYLAWVEEQTGEELTDLFDAWLLAEESPLRQR